MEAATQLQVFPEKKKVPRPNQDRPINSKQFMARRYREVELDDYYGPIFGEIEGRSVVMGYGASGMGKSTFILALANFLAEKYGKTIYNSHEERLGKSLQTRVREVLGDKVSLNLYFGDAWNFETLMGRIKKNRYRVVVIDSVQYAHFTYDQLKELRATFKKRNIIVIMVSFGTALGKTKGADDMLHASDVKLFFKNGKLTSISRYNSNKIVHKRLFNPNAEEGGLL